MSVRVPGILLALAAAFLVTAPAVQAQWWHHHPGYLHAMSDLRTAYWLVQHRDADDPQMYRDERATLGDIRNAYQELKNASILDNKDIDDQPPAQTNFYDHRGRLNHALDLLREARDDISREEDDPEARGLRNKAIMHINYGINHIKDAIEYWRF